MRHGDPLSPYADYCPYAKENGALPPKGPKPLTRKVLQFATHCSESQQSLAAWFKLGLPPQANALNHALNFDLSCSLVGQRRSRFAQQDATATLAPSVSVFRRCCLAVRGDVKAWIWPGVSLLTISWQPYILVGFVSSRFKTVRGAKGLEPEHDQGPALFPRSLF